MTNKKTKPAKSSAETIEHYEVHTSSGTYYTDVREQAIRWAKKNKQKRIQVIKEIRSVLMIDLGCSKRAPAPCASVSAELAPTEGAVV